MLFGALRSAGSGLLGNVGRLAIVIAVLVVLILGRGLLSCIRQDASDDTRAGIERDATTTVTRIEKRHEEIERDAARGGAPAVDERLRNGTFFAPAIPEGGGDPAQGRTVHPGGAGQGG